MEEAAASSLSLLQLRRAPHRPLLQHPPSSPLPPHHAGRHLSLATAGGCRVTTTFRKLIIVLIPGQGFARLTHREKKRLYINLFFIFSLEYIVYCRNYDMFRTLQYSNVSHYQSSDLYRTKGGNWEGVAGSRFHTQKLAESRRPQRRESCRGRAEDLPGLRQFSLSGWQSS